MKNKKWHTYLKVISLSGLMAFIVLTSCNVRKGIQTLVGQEVQKQLLPSKSVQQSKETCSLTEENFKAQLQVSNHLDFDFDSLHRRAESDVDKISALTVNQLSPLLYSSYKVGLYLLFQQLKIHH